VLRSEIPVCQPWGGCARGRGDGFFEGGWGLGGGGEELICDIATEWMGNPRRCAWLSEGEIVSWLRGVGKEMRCRWVRGGEGEDCDVRVRVSCIITHSETIFQANDILCFLEHESWTRKTMENSWTGNNCWKRVCSSDDQDSNGEM